MEITFREAPQSVSSEPQISEKGLESTGTGPSLEAEPLNNNSMPQTVLDVLGIDDNLSDLPSEEVEKINDITSYLSDHLKSVGKVPTALTLGRKLDEMREELDMDDQTEPSVLIDRLGGVVKAWRNLGFVKDPASKRSLFMKLARCPDSKSMNKLIFNEMNRREAWM